MADFERLYRENRSFIFKYLCKLSKSPSLAEELTQETFFRAYMNIKALKNEKKAASWLCSIAKNAYFSFYNEQKKVCQLDENIISDEEDIEGVLIKKELSERAFACLDGLGEPYKEVFSLRVIGGLSLKEISSLFSKSESWARVTFYRAKQMLIERIKEYEL